MGFSKLAVEKLMYRAGATRINEDAIVVLKKFLEDAAYSATERAVKIAKSGNRKRVLQRDFEVAFDILKKDI